MAEVKLSILHDSIVDMVLNSANPTMPISEIIKQLEDIKNKGKEVNMNDARNMQYLAVQLVRMSRDTMARFVG